MKYKEEWKSEERKKELKEAAPDSLIKNINNDNNESVKLRLRFDPCYFEFLEKFIGMLEFEPVTCTYLGLSFLSLSFISFRFCFKISKIFNENLKHSKKLRFFLRHLIYSLVAFDNQSDFIFDTLQKGTRFVMDMLNDSSTKESTYKSWMTTLKRHYAKHMPVRFFFERKIRY